MSDVGESDTGEADTGTTPHRGSDRPPDAAFDLLGAKSEPEERPAVPAATVIVLRDRALGVEVLLLRRVQRGAFAGMWVFPGGQVDAADADPLARDDEERTARRAAAREALEEAGLHLDPDRLVAFSHWTPPASAPRRFATWFFAAEAPEGEVVVDRGEVHEHLWLTPAEALARHGADQLQLAPPTWVTLYQLSVGDRVEDVLAAATQRPFDRFLTRPIRVDGVAVLVWHGDAAYDDGIDRDGARHRLWMLPGGWRYERG
jgi:8-oxo-dGTP pyrophosphatase MutT (NUDIX family)